MFTSYTVILDDDELEIRVCHELILFLIAMIVRISYFCLQRETDLVGAFSSIQLRFSFWLETEGREKRRLDHRERSYDYVLSSRYSLKQFMSQPDVAVVQLPVWVEGRVSRRGPSVGAVAEPVGGLRSRLSFVRASWRAASAASRCLLLFVLAPAFRPPARWTASAQAACSTDADPEIFEKESTVHLRFLHFFFSSRHLVVHTNAVMRAMAPIVASPPLIFFVNFGSGSIGCSNCTRPRPKRIAPLQMSSSRDQVVPLLHPFCRVSTGYVR